jgi:HEAT repeat protein
MKFPPAFADISGDMRQTGRRSPSTFRSDVARDLIAASDTARVVSWVEALVRTIEARRTRPRDDAVLHKIHSEFHEATQSCLDQLGDLTIGVEEYDLFFEGECVYHSTPQDGSLSVALFRDGLREIVLRRGLEPEELRAFVDILARATAVGDQDSEGVVTLLWEESFRHIGYECVPFEEWNPEPGANGEEFEGRSADGALPWPAGAIAEEEIGSSPGEPAEGRSDDWSLPVDGGAVSDQPLPALSNLTEIEAHNICMVAGIEDALSPRDRVLGILWALLEAEEDPAKFLEIASSLGRLVEHVVAAGDMAEAGNLVDRLRDISASKRTTPSEFQSATNRVLEQLGRSDFLGQLGAILSRHRDLDLAALTQFLARLGPAAAPTLCGILGDIEEMKARRAICEALVISCKSHVSILLDRLSDPRWYVVRNILYILGRIAHQGVERALGDALTHNDVRVRKEAVRALGGIDSPASRAYLNSALRDSDKSIRVLVAQMLASRKDERAARIIWSVIEAPEFAARDLDERVAFCGALARAGSDPLIPKMEKMLTRGGMFQSAEQAGRMEAAMALAWLGTPAALDVLSREAKNKNESVRRAVADALETVREFAAKDRREG